MKRVVVTGMGAITPVGLNVEEFWKSIRESRIGFGEVTYFDTSDYKAHLAAEVRGLMQITIWTLRRLRECRCSAGMQWQQQRRPFGTPDLIWNRRTRFGWDVRSEAESEVCR